MPSSHPARPVDSAPPHRPRSVAHALAALGLGLLLLAADPALAKRRHTPPKASGFNYYVLALTWTPGFCATHSDPAECGHGLGFGLHGLWPQVDARHYPANCGRAALPEPVREQYKTLYPSPTMIDHEWEKHGTCSGLSPADYFALSEKARAAVKIPPAYATARTVGAQELPALKAAFLAANPGLAANGFSATTADRILTEVRICLDKSLAFRACQP